MTAAVEDGPTLLARVRLVCGSSPATLEPHLDVVAPLVVRCTQASEGRVRAGALDAVCLLVSDAAGLQALEPHLTGLVSFLLRCTRVKEVPSAAARIAALGALERIAASLPYHRVHPLRNVVASGLAKGALDDPKRAVRAQAVKCRDRWSVFNV